MDVSCKWPSIAMVAPARFCQVSWPVKERAARPPSNTKTVWISALRAIWPRFSASSRRRGVGCSVFSPVCSLISTAREQLRHLNEILGQSAQVIKHVLSRQLQGEAENDQSAGNPEGEALGENVHLRHRAAENRKNEGNDKRNGDNGRRDLQSHHKNAAGM